MPQSLSLIAISLFLLLTVMYPSPSLITISSYLCRILWCPQCCRSRQCLRPCRQSRCLNIVTHSCVPIFLVYRDIPTTVAYCDVSNTVAHCGVAVSLSLLIATMSQSMSHIPVLLSFVLTIVLVLSDGWHTITGGFLLCNIYKFLAKPCTILHYKWFLYIDKTAKLVNTCIFCNMLLKHARGWRNGKNRYALTFFFFIPPSIYSNILSRVLIFFSSVFQKHFVTDMYWCSLLPDIHHLDWCLGPVTPCIAITKALVWFVNPLQALPIQIWYLC